MLRLLLVLPGLVIGLVILGVIAFLVLGRQRLDKIEVNDGVLSSEAGTYRVAIEHDGREREYLVHVPPAAKAGTALPLFIALHGGGGTAERTEDLIELTPIADREGFLVAFPQGVGKGWNDGRPGSGAKAQKENVDDVGFIGAVIDDINRKLPVDAKRVYAAGISNGAIMSNRLACEASDRIAAVGLVAGTAPEGFETTCRPGRPVPLIAFLSTKDPLVPYGGGSVKSFIPFVKRGRVVSADGLKQFWVRNNECSGAPVVTALPDQTTEDHSYVVLEAYSGCRGGADVAIYRVEGGGHTWPGGKQYMTRRLVGRTNRDVNASELIWAFFEAHPRE